MNIPFKYLLLLSGIVCIFSCKSKPVKNHGPIVLGDTATIVTENDPRRLQDLVTELTPDIPPAKADTAKQHPEMQVHDTDKNGNVAVAVTPPPQPAAASGPSLNAQFKETTILIPGINVKISGKEDLSRANGAVYTLTDATFTGHTMQVSGNITKVSQRYQSIVVLKTKNGQLPLDALSETTGWEPVKGGNGKYPITGLAEHDLEFPTANNSTIRNAIMKAGQRRHFSRKKIQEWISAAGNVRAANQKPLVVTLRSVMWKIDGKDPQGKMFSKQIRVDIPM